MKEKLLRKVREKFEKILFKEELEELIELIEDYYPEDIKKDNIDSIIKYAEKIYQKKYGEDEIFISYPIPAKIRIELTKFKKENNIDYEKYKTFIDWLVLIENKNFSVFSLYDNRLYDKYLNQYDKKEIEISKKISKKRLFSL